MAACTNQPNIVSFLMENAYRRADLTDKDSQGNTVLHTLVVIADNTTENTDMIARMYDEILIQHNKLEKKNPVQLEAIENNQGLTPLKLAAKLGKIGVCLLSFKGLCAYFQTHLDGIKLFSVGALLSYNTDLMHDLGHDLSKHINVCP